MTKTHHHNEEPESDQQSLVNHAKENPMLYVGGIAVIAFVVIATLLFRLNSDLKSRDQASVFAAALDIEDPMEKMEALGEITKDSSKYIAEVLYMHGHAAMESEDYETAKASFTTLRDKHPGFEFTPDGVEALGAIHEINSDYEAAIAVYKDIQATWPDSFAARRQPFNIARCHEENDNPDEALAAYQDQLQTFPGSNVAAHAQQKLDQLRAKNPTLALSPVETPLLEAAPDTTN
ncbi:MAG TPA: tetratricopeptide repeat protein [Candidatus Hydrogenedentes bacterium]|nr:tetratricopeptide repeat protein [Candidatus Hydrogenedentota bacterium]